MKNFIAAYRYAVILGMAVFVSTGSTQSQSIPPAVDTTSALTNLTPPSIDSVPTRPELTRPAVDTTTLHFPLKRKINYTGAALSAFVPGSGQVYQSRYVMGGLFLASEATAVGFTVYWSGSADAQSSDARRLRALSDTLYGRGEIDTANREKNLVDAGRYSVLADEADFEARASRHTAYNALAWAAGLHLYNVLYALEAGGLAPRGLEKNPTTAGLLAAVPFVSLGHLYNERPAKAGMLAMTQAGLALTAYNQHRLMSIASEKYNQMRDTTSMQYAYRADHLSYWKSRYDGAFSGRNTYLWLSLAAYLYSIIDAVVDAYLSDFDAKIDLGTDLSAAPGGGGAAISVTVGLRSK